MKLWLLSAMEGNRLARGWFPARFWLTQRVAIPWRDRLLVVHRKPAANQGPHRRPHRHC